MILLGILSELLLYTCFALLMGDYLLAMVPEERKPEVRVPKFVRLFAVAGIILFSFIPILDLAVYLKADYGIAGALEVIITTFTVGQAWIITLLIAIILGMFTSVIDGMEEKRYPWVGAGLTLLLILCMGWAGHATSIYPFQGFVTHVLHFLAVTVWIGILLVISFFSKTTDNWSRFLQWFHVTAILCFLVTLGSGLVMMELIVTFETYTESWLLPYGQSLLIKHILIIPLLLYALVNGVFTRRKLQKETDFNPKPWTKVEFAIVALIFSATGALGQQSPPHNINSLLENEGASFLFSLFHGEIAGPVTSVSLSFDVIALLVGVIAAMFLVLGFVSFMKKISPPFSFVMGMLFLVAGYSALMLSVQVN